LVASTLGKPEGAGQDDCDELTIKRARQYIADTLRPNSYIGIYYTEIAKEYALPRNVDSQEGKGFYNSVFLVITP